MNLSQKELLRYTRHFPVIGLEGQASLKKAKILIIGAGGLGNSAAQYLCAAGMGELGIVDHDTVSLNNLHRQVLFTEEDIGNLKVTCIKNRLIAQNPYCKISPYSVNLNEENAEQIMQPYDLVLDCCDNYRTRYLINDVCHLLKKPLISASIYQFQGQLSVFNYQEGPCYRCIYPQPPPPELSPNCEIAGVLGVLPGILGSLQAAEAIKIITKQGQPLLKRLLQMNVATLCFQEYEINKNPGCPLCQQGELSGYLFKKKDIKEEMVSEIEPQLLSSWLQQPDQCIHLIDVREPFERSICSLGGELMPSSHFNVNNLKIQNDQLIVVYCKLGGRSQKIAQLLKTHGYQNIYSLKGGIIGWIDHLDPSMNRY